MSVSISSKPSAGRGRSAARRDLVVVAVALAVLLIGASIGLFAAIHSRMDRLSEGTTDAVFGALLVGALTATCIALFRRSESRRDSLLRTETETRFQAMVEQVPAVAYRWDSANLPGAAPAAYISPQIEHLLGFPAEAWLQDPGRWQAQLHPDDVEMVLQRWDDAVRSADTFVAEYRINAASGRLVWVRDEAVPVAEGTSGRPIYQGVMYDVTERRLAEARLRTAEEGYRSLVEQLPAVVYVDAVDDIATAQYISPGYERLTGYSPEQRLADPRLWVNMLHEEDRDAVLAESDRTNRTGEPFDVEYRIVRADADTRWVRDQAILINGPDGRPVWQGVLTDITDRKLAQEALGRRDRILEATGYAAERLLRAPTWRECIDDVLRALGDGGSATRAALFENADVDGVTGVALRHAWLAPDAPSCLDRPPIAAPYGEDLDRWLGVLDGGGVIHGSVDDLPESERARLTAQGIRAVIAVPVHVEGSWWGYIGFDHCDRERPWQPAEIDAIRVAANTLGAAIERERAAARLGETEARYRTLVEQIPAITYVEDSTEGTAVYTSPQMHALLGYGPQEWGRRDQWRAAIHPDDRNRVIAEDDRTNRTGEPFRMEYRLMAKDGRIVWVRDEAVLLRDEDGARRYWQGVRFDITAEKTAEEHLREAEERYRAIVEHVPAAIYLDTADTSMRTIYISPQIEDIAGVTPQEWIDHPDLWLEMIPRDDREAVGRSYLDAIANGRAWKAEYRILTRDGRAIWVHDETTILHDADGEPAYLQGVLMDVTERKLAEQALRESERSERAAAERLRALDEMKNTFLAAVSHELRSPLTSILGLSITLERSPDMDALDRQDLVSRLSVNARKLDRLLKDLLDIDRLNRGIVAPQYRTIDVGSLARRTVENMEAVADRTVIVDAGAVVVSVDPPKIERIVENLVMNAARHTSADRTIWLTVGPFEDGVLIAVEDDGPGVPADLRTVIFEPFRQGPSVPSHAPGTGIGLSLVGRFAELHGGTAWVQDRPGGGASFRVRLPAGPPVDEPAPAEPASAEPASAGSS